MKRWIMIACLLAAGLAWWQTTSGESTKRVLVLGIDGGTWSMMEPMMAAGELPHIKKLYEKGLHGVLESRPPIVSPVVWTTIFTGVDHKTHGISDWKTSQSTNRKVSALWNITRAKKIRTDVFNVPGSWPAEPVNGVMVAGFPLSGSTFAGNTGEVITNEEIDQNRVPAAYRDNLEEIRAQVKDLAVGQWTPWLVGKVASRPNFRGAFRAMRLAPDRIYVTPLYRNDNGIVMTDPPELRASISKRIGEPYIPEGPGWSRWADSDTPAYLYAHLKQVFDIQNNAALEYIGGDWDLFLYVMTLVDRVSHPYWAYGHTEDYPSVDPEKAKRYESAVADAYRASDEALGEILAKAKGEFYVMVISDHGFGTYSDKTKAVGAHDPDGIYMVSGPGIRARAGERAFIEDVTPTLLYMMGLPVGQDMTGKPIAEVTADLGRPLATIATYELGDRDASDMPVDDATWEQLRGLGYVDGAPPRQEMKDKPKAGEKPAAGDAEPPKSRPKPKTPAADSPKAP